MFFTCDQSIRSVFQVRMTCLDSCTSRIEPQLRPQRGGRQVVADAWVPATYMRIVYLLFFGFFLSCSPPDSFVFVRFLSYRVALILNNREQYLTLPKAQRICRLVADITHSRCPNGLWNVAVSSAAVYANDFLNGLRPLAVMG